MAKVKQVKDQVDDQKAAGEGAVFTYVGAGEDSPRVINFMGKQKFVRGEQTEVTDPEVLAKIKGNPTFIEGEASQEQLHAIDEEGSAEAEGQRKIDRETDKSFQRSQAKLAKHDDGK